MVEKRVSEKCEKSNKHNMVRQARRSSVSLTKHLTMYQQSSIKTGSEILHANLMSNTLGEKVNSTVCPHLFLFKPIIFNIILLDHQWQTLINKISKSDKTDFSL